MPGSFYASIEGAAKLEALRLKTLAAERNLLLTNRAMVKGILEVAKPIVEEKTPLGPGHFGYHGRDTLKIKVEDRGLRAIGKLVAAVQLNWREFGTRGRSRRGLTARQTRAVVAFLGSGGGEPAFMTAHKAVGGFRRVVSFYYGGLAKWWNSPPL